MTPPRSKRLQSLPLFAVCSWGLGPNEEVTCSAGRLQWKLNYKFQAQYKAVAGNLTHTPAPTPWMCVCSCVCVRPHGKLIKVLLTHTVNISLNLHCLAGRGSTCFRAWGYVPNISISISMPRPLPTKKRRRKNTKTNRHEQDTLAKKEPENQKKKNEKKKKNRKTKLRNWKKRKSKSAKGQEYAASRFATKAGLENWNTDTDTADDGLGLWMKPEPVHRGTARRRSFSYLINYAK